ncbi:MAG: GH92 family glycosyl hydrolase [Pyrinomonadaceae bacterium]|nr:GH92 family glycosyl hydrolase [Pyrinomonadaceae bacterium]
MKRDKCAIKQFKKGFIFAFLLFTFYFNLSAQTKDFTKYVNPFIGTGGHGHTFPGATVPFGMVQLSPDTRLDNWDGSSGYHYSDSIIYGFSHTHLSGTGIPDYCDILFAPNVGESVDFYDYKSTFSHTNEKAEAGYYAVKLDNGITAELTASERVGFHSYTFPKGKTANIFLDLKWRDKVLGSEMKIAGTNRIEGHRRSSSWAKDQIVYFVAEFSKPFESSVVKTGENLQTTDWQQNKQKQLVYEGNDIKASFRFQTSDNEKILLKVAISPVSIEGARKNLAAEIPGWNFDKIRNDAKAKWNKELSKIEVSGGTDEQMTNFYTALYHLNIQPNIFSDVDGNYLGLDRKIHNLNENRVSSPRVSKGSNDSKNKALPNGRATDTQKSENYTVFSLWDTFRAAHPLYTVIDEKRTADFINTFIRQYEQGGRLPVWELAGNETDTMIGYHAVSVIADAMAKGIEGFDYEKAYIAAKHSAELDHFGLSAYKKRGYISMEDENEGVSKTLEYAYNDFCIAQMAQILTNKEINEKRLGKFGWYSDEKYLQLLRTDSLKYFKRAQYYKNLFDVQTGFMRPRKNGGFVSPFQPNEVTFHFTEGNSWVYSFFVPHDVSGLIELQGGKGNFAKKLDQLFTTEDELTGREQPDITGLIGQYAHGNEPSHHIAYLFNYVEQPWRTQELVHRILNEFYKNQPDGLIGNEDCGQMSAWYIMSALGFYQVAPSIPRYDIGTPLFREAKINLENGKTFTIKAPNVSNKNIYVESVELNGKEHSKTFFEHSDIIKGGVLAFNMTDAELAWKPREFSKTAISETGFVAIPTIEAKDRVFTDSTTVSLRLNSTDPLAVNLMTAKILYSIDGGEPKTEYKRPFTVDKTATVKAVAVNKKGAKSFPVEAKFTRLPHDWTVKILSKYNRQYTGGGDEGLIDGIRGTLNFASGEWQGYQDQDFVAVIDLKRETEIKRVGGGFLQDARPWIWMPTRIEFETSNDGENFTKIAGIKTDVAPEDMKPQIKDYFQNIAPAKARYVRVKAINLGKIPAWHPGAGFDAFIFVDEIFID